jgi:hypothetical protein
MLDDLESDVEGTRGRLQVGHLTLGLGFMV